MSLLLRSSKKSGEVEEGMITVEKPAPVAKSVLDASSSQKVNEAPEVIDLSYSLHSSQPASSAPTSPSTPKMCYTMQFNFEELKKGRQQKLLELQASKNTPGKSKTKGCYTAATLELFQAVNEDAKARALSAQ